MIYVACLALVGLVVVALAFAQVIRQLIREHARERQLMLNQLMHLAGRTWEPAPVDYAGTPAPPGLDDEQLLAAEMELLDPAQLPVDYS